MSNQRSEERTPSHPADSQAQAQQLPTILAIVRDDGQSYECAPHPEAARRMCEVNNICDNPHHTWSVVSYPPPLSLEKAQEAIYHEVRGTLMLQLDSCEESDAAASDCTDSILATLGIGHPSP